MGCHQIGTLQSLTLCALFPLEAPLFQKNFGARADPLPGKKFQPFLFTWRAPRRVTTMKAISYALATAWLWHSVRISSEATRIHTRKCNTVITPETHQITPLTITPETPNPAKKAGCAKV